MKTKWVILSAFVFAVLLISCDDDDGTDTGDGDNSLSGSITISPSGTVNVGTTLTANYTGTETVRYQWKKGTSNVGTNINRYTPTTTGTYTVTVSAEGYDPKTSAEVTVKDPDIPDPVDLLGDISISPPGPVNVGTTLTATYTGEETVSYQWKRGESNYGANSRNYTPNQVGSYTVTVSAEGCNPKTSAAVIVNNIPNLPGNLTISPSGRVLAGTPLSAEYTGEETVVYQWKKDGADISGANSRNYTPNQVGNYAVTVSAAGFNPKISTLIAPVYENMPGTGSTLAQKLAWVRHQNNVQPGQIYTLEVYVDEAIAPQPLSYANNMNVTITLKGIGGQRVVSLSDFGALFTVDTGVTLILDENITLQGRIPNNDSVVKVTGGTLIMNNGSVITGNENSGTTFGGGVFVGDRSLTNTRGTFTMNGGTISGNTVNATGIASGGGGVYVDRGDFTMKGGTISGNTVNIGIGNVSLYIGGGGVSVYAVTMIGATFQFGSFAKTGGTITGYADDTVNGNVVKDYYGTVVSMRGHAAFIISNNLDRLITHREATAGSGLDLSYKDNKSTGWWDYD